MSDVILNAVRREAVKLVTRHQRYAWALHEEVKRRSLRDGLPRTKAVLKPSYWQCAPGFDPYYVRKHARGIAYAVEKALRAGTYAPQPAINYAVPKADGGTREVAVFQVADQAVSRLVFGRLLQKNKGRFSARSFAYRNDLSVHDAIVHLASSLRGRGRVFMAEYDFKRYFENLSHDHIERVLEDKRFFITPEERRIVMAFARAEVRSATAFGQSAGTPRVRGIPQGASTSLFLANIAAAPLDRRLEQLRVDFARYADDTLIWSDDYGELCRAVDALAESAKEMGVEFNTKKSPGIRILVDEPSDPRAEFSPTNHVEFLGYQVNANTIGIRETSVERIKKYVNWLVFSNLVEGPQAGHVLEARLGEAIDRDYRVLISQLQRFIYGNLSEEKLSRYLVGDAPRMHYQGLMSFYPLVDDREQLRALDGWLLHTVSTALRLRRSLFSAANKTLTSFPHGPGVTSANLVQPSAGGLRLPSFYRIAKLLNRASEKYGATALVPRGPSS